MIQSHCVEQERLLPHELIFFFSPTDIKKNQLKAYEEVSSYLFLMVQSSTHLLFKQPASWGHAVNDLLADFEQRL